MDIDAQIQHLLTAATPAEATELKIRMNAYASTGKAYNADSCASNHRAFELARESRAALVGELWARYGTDAAAPAESTEPLRTRQEVAAFVQSMGFKCSDRTVTNHTKARKLVRRQDGFWHQEDVLAWIKKTGSLHRIDGGSDDLKSNDLQHRKLDAETRRAEADARLKGLRADVLDGKLVPAEIYERALALRAAAFKKGILSMYHGILERCIETVSGDPTRAPHLLDLLLSEAHAHFNHYDTDQPLSADPQDIQDVLALPEL